MAEHTNVVVAINLSISNLLFELVSTLVNTD